MSIVLTINDSRNLGIDEILDMVPHSKAAEEVKTLRQIAALVALNEMATEETVDMAKTIMNKICE